MSILVFDAARRRVTPSAPDLPSTDVAITTPHPVRAEDPPVHSPVSPSASRILRSQACVARSLPTVARYAVAGPVRPRLTEALFIGDRVRRILMGCSQKTASSANAAAVFSGKLPDGSRLEAGHQHAHFLCEANAGDHRITRLTVYAPMGFSTEDERALARLQRVWGRDGYDLQMVLLGVGQPAEFGGANEKAGQSPLLAESAAWISRTPFVPTRHLKLKRSQLHDPGQRQQATASELCRAVRLELERRDAFERVANDVQIQPLLGRDECGIMLGGHFTRWLDFRRERKSGQGSRVGSLGYGFVLRFPQPIRGPIALGYGCHFGLGQFVPLTDETDQR